MSHFPGICRFFIPYSILNLLSNIGPVFHIERQVSAQAQSTPETAASEVVDKTWDAETDRPSKKKKKRTYERRCDLVDRFPLHTFPRFRTPPSDRHSPWHTTNEHIPLADKTLSGSFVFIPADIHHLVSGWLLCSTVDDWDETNIPLLPGFLRVQIDFDLACYTSLAVSRMSHKSLVCSSNSYFGLLFLVLFWPWSC